MCWAFDSCEEKSDHTHCQFCGEVIPGGQYVCEPLCEEGVREGEMLEAYSLNGGKPVSYCCICGGLGFEDRKCWGCQ